MIYLLIIFIVLFLLIFIAVRQRLNQVFYKLTTVLTALFIVSGVFAGANNISNVPKGKPTGEYLVLMTSIGLAYGVFLVIRARRRKRSRIFLQYGRSEFTS